MSGQPSLIARAYRALRPDLALQPYRTLLRNRRMRQLLVGMCVSSAGDGMSVVAVPWMAVRLAPHDATGLFVGGAVAAYTLPGAIGAVLLSRLLRRRSARGLVIANCTVRTVLFSAIATFSLLGKLAPAAYVLLLAGSSVLFAWGTAGQYTMLSALGGPSGRLAANSLANAQASAAVIAGPAIAGLLIPHFGPAWLIALDAASFASLGLQASRVPLSEIVSEPPVDTAVVESGFQLLRRRRLLGLVALTWLFFFLYGPVETALPVYVAHDAQQNANLLGVYWSAYGAGALLASLIAGALRGGHDNRALILLIVAGWGACLVPFMFAPVGVTIACFAVGGLIYGPYIPLTYAMFQSATTTANLPSVLAARSAFTVIATPLGAAVGGPLVGALGASRMLTASGATTMLLAAATAIVWRKSSRLGSGPIDI
jgi:predicted MFS family arabinose efflux permease